MIKVRLEKFEGPLSLLMKLIEKEELDITEVSLATVADQFVSYIKSSDSIGPEEMADFLVVAARLLLIKSKALLPYLYPEEEAEIDELEKQLKMYKEFVEAAKKIEKLAGKKKFMFAREFNRQAILQDAKLFSPPKKLIAAELKTIMAEIIMRIRPAEKLEEGRIEQVVNIEEKIARIQNLLLARIKFNFRKVLESSTSKTELIVSFLAMLELEKQRDIMIEQSGLFADIFISRYESGSN